MQRHKYGLTIKASLSRQLARLCDADHYSLWVTIMKKQALAILFVFISLNGYSWECEEGMGGRDPVKHWNNARDVILVRILSGEVLRVAEADYKYKAEILHKFKGTLKEEIEFTQNESIGGDGLSIGTYYVLYFDSTRPLNFCDGVFDVWVDRSNVYESVVASSERVDIVFSRFAKHLIQMEGVNP